MRNVQMKTTLIARVLGILLIALLLATGCGDDGRVVDPETNITGSVTDSVTGAPISGARLSVNDTTASARTVTSDSTGTYYIAFLGAADFRLICRKDGYRTEWVDTSTVSGPLVIESLDFELADRGPAFGVGFQGSRSGQSGNGRLR